MNTTSLFDQQLESARSAYRLAELLEEQANRPHVGDDLTSRVQVLQRRAQEQRQFGETRAQEAFRYALYFQLAS